MAIALHDVQAALAAASSPAPSKPSGRRASIAAVLLPNLDLLFIRRAEHPRDPWSGHVAFPGGKQDPHDATPLAAAIRESREELGLNLAPAHLIAPLNDLATFGAQPGLTIRPFVFALPEEPTITPNEEVRSVHRLPLDHLLSGRGRGSFELDWRGSRVRLPEVHFDGVKLWGLTLQAVDDLLNRLDGRGVGLARPAGLPR